MISLKEPYRSCTPRLTTSPRNGLASSDQPLKLSCTTQMYILDLPFFSHFRLRAKINYLRPISTSNDPLLKELASCFSTNLSDSCPPQCLNLLQAVRTSLPPSSNPNARLKQVSKLVVRDYQASHWDNHAPGFPYSPIQVQRHYCPRARLQGMEPHSIRSPSWPSEFHPQGWS